MSNRSQAHRVADTRYGAKLSQKVIKFNTEKVEDIERLRKIQQIPDFANWVKSKIDELPSL
jgi:hypothetical protein